MFYSREYDEGTLTSSVAASLPLGVREACWIMSSSTRERMAVFAKIECRDMAWFSLSEERRGKD